MLQRLARHKSAWLFFASFFAVFLFTWHPLTDSDFWWHLRLGEMMLYGHGIPRTEQFSWTMTGRLFVDFNWLVEIVFAALFNLLKPLGFTLFFALFATAILLFQIRRSTKFRFLDFITALLFGAALMQITGVRPHIFSWLFFVILLLLVERIDRISLKLLAVIAVLLFTIWYNMQDGFVLPLLYLGFTIGIDVLFRVFQFLEQPWAPKPYLSNTALRNLIALAMIATICLFFTPYGINYPKTILLESGSEINKTYILEWQPLALRSQLGLLYYTLGISTLVLAAYYRIFKAQDWVIAFLFFFVGAAGAVHSGFALLFFAPIFTKLLYRIPFPHSLQTYAKIYCGVAAVVAVIAAVATQWNGIQFPSMLDPSAFPVQAIAAVQKLQPQGKMYNAYNWGGYLDYTLPQYPVFVDGRMAAWQRNSQSILSDTYTINNLWPGFDTLLRQYQPDWFLIPPNFSLTQWLKTNPKYQVVYEDKTAVVIVKKHSQ